MGFRDYRNAKIPLLGDENNALTWLVIINCSVFMVLNFIKIVYYVSDIPQEFFQHQILDWFSLPASFDKLGSRPWVVLSYMFSHVDVWQLISSLLWLWGFGYILQDLTGNNKLIPIYIYGGFVGGLFFLLTSNIVPALAHNVEFMQMVGGGSAVMAIAVATTTLAPDYRIFPMINGGIPLWVATVVFVAIDFATIASASGGMAVAHLAGGAMGYFYIRQLRSTGKDIGKWMTDFMNWLNDLFNPEKKYTPKSQKEQLYYNATKPPFKKIPNVTQQRVDELLDKINQEGYHMLTDEEKAFLKKASKEEL